MAGTDVTKDVVRQLIPFLSRKHISITPENYRVWFEYFLGRKEEIKKRLDELMASDAVFNEELNGQLYEEFFVRDLDRESTEKVRLELETAEELSQKVSEMVVNIMKDVLSGVESTSGYGEKLKKYITSVEKTGKLESVETLLKNMLKDTQEASSQTQRVQKKLETSSTELEHLHAELVNAKTEARTDNLTRLWNRRFFDENLAEALKKAKKGGIGSLILLDIDFFKKFNDEYGHLIGDKLLKHVAKEIRKMSPAAAHVCRYGGEEFGIIYADAGLATALALAEKIRKEIEAVSFTVRGMDVDVTISIGVAEMRPHDQPATIIERADAAMYLAKRSGRNNVKTEKEVPAGADDASH